MNKVTLEDQIQKLVDYYGDDSLNEDKLDPTLQQFLTTGRSGMRMIKHPLLTAFFTSWREANEVFEWKSKEYVEAMRTSNYEYALSVLITRPHRLEFLRKWWRARKITREQLRAQLPWVWTDSEPDDTDRRWVTLFRDATRYDGKLEYNHYGDVTYPFPEDEVLTIYRGTHYREDKLGLAWSLSRNVAEIFSSYMRIKDQAHGWVVTGQVKRTDVMGYFMNRMEYEIDVDPRLITVTSWEQMTTSV